MPTNVRDHLERTLRLRRAELLREAAICERALCTIAEERESELEEDAQEAQMDGVLGRLDDRERREIVEIDAALDRLADGTYGRCRDCERPIEIDRLAALPETPLCLRCAATQAAAHPTAARRQPKVGAVPSDLVLLDDDELETLLRETIEADDRIDREELRITCRRGVVHLDGVLPSVSEHAMLRRLIEDVLGFRDVVDRIRVDEGPWERTDRAKAEPGHPVGFEPIGTADVVESVEEGIPFLPGDRPPADEE